eukprot:2582318-Amphidinium_carterae.1
MDFAQSPTPAISCQDSWKLHLCPHSAPHELRQAGALTPMGNPSSSCLAPAQKAQCNSKAYPNHQTL